MQKPYVLPAEELYYVFRLISAIKLDYFLIEHKARIVFTEGHKLNLLNLYFVLILILKYLKHILLVVKVKFI
jgi:hypothetical protein